MARLLPPDTDTLIPVPLHRWRLWSRGFNQALLMAESIGRTRAVPVERSLLLRTRRTPPLKGLGRRMRAKAVRGVFTVPASHRAALRGKAVVLVDDVYTSGATADACTRALLKAGAAKVTILCWARVLDTSAEM
jgi:ComF family protein